MATLQGVSGIDVRALVAEWERLLPLWVSKVYEVTPGTVLVRLQGRDHARYQLLVEPPRSAHLTTRPIRVPQMPSGFAMLLRKYLSGGRVLGIRQHGIQRIIVMDVGKHDHLYHLVIELFDRGNIILCDRDWTIIQPLSRYHFRERDIAAGAVYCLPPPGPATGTLEEFARFLGEESRDIVRALAVGAMLGGPYAEYLCRRAGIPKNLPARDVAAAPLFQEVERLLERAEKGIEPHLLPETCLPFPLEGEERQGTPTGLAFNLALDQFFPPPETRGDGSEAAKAKKVSREERVRVQQQQAVEKFQKKIAQCERAVEAIFSHYPLVTQVLEALRQARETHSWQEIEAFVMGQKEGPAARIVAVYPDRGAVDLDLGERVTLSVGESIEKNAATYYEEIKKYRKKIAGAEAAMEKALAPRFTRPSRRVAGKKRWYNRFRWFFTSDGTLVVGGRDASQNEELVKKYMEGGDLFVHADVHGASVVIVKGKTERMDEVATFAASYSGAWKSGHLAADVYCVRPDQVSKTPEAGEFVSRGAFIVRGERTYFRNVPLGVAIGFQREPELVVIGGPPSAVRARTPLFVELEPGRFEPNDVAKKVLRVLREKVPEGDAKDLKNILITEAVAAFVPAGGSDIREAP
ncbi:MAG: NFACT family protein [Methanolinea sp.]|nr:NFACT family protein [Methanolinea sp.]